MGKISQTWALFESGNCAEIALISHAPYMDQKEPVCVRLIGGFLTAEVEQSAERAAESVVSVLRNRYAAAIGPYHYALDLYHPGGAIPIAGESGGLAFAVALSKSILGQDPGPVAATGVISRAGDPAHVGRVEGISKKLAGAATVLPEGARLLVPSTNSSEIPDDLRSDLEAKGIQLEPVSSVEDALDLLFPPDLLKAPETQAKKTVGAKPGHSPRKKRGESDEPRRGRFGKKFLWAAPIVAAGMIAALVWGLDYSKQDSLPPVTPAPLPTLPIAMPPKAPPPPMVKFRATGGLIGQLARELEAEIEKRALSQRFGASVPRLTGNVAIRWIEETTTADGTLNASIVALATNLVFESEGKSIRLKNARAEVRGRGSARELTHVVAEVLARKITVDLEKTRT